MIRVNKLFPVIIVTGNYVGYAVMRTVLDSIDILLNMGPWL